MSSEKQAHPRTRGRLLVRYGLEEPDKTAFTMNVSLTGAFLRTNHVFRPGTTIRVEFEFPETKHLVLAQVVWAKRVPLQLAHVLTCGMGVRFVDPGPEWQEIFGRWAATKA